ncbi:MAG: TonB C-terminal domain-containing protein [Cyanobacteriota/Melainabacteria group bacterium]|nr:TonB C-terminal domain-containing protein [Cyanobacteria bacterium HKST-UBA01]
MKPIFILALATFIGLSWTQPAHALAPAHSKSELSGRPDDVRRLLEAYWVPVITDRPQDPVEFSFRLLKSGQLSDLKLTRSSGVAASDQSALMALRRTFVESAPVRLFDEEVLVKAVFGDPVTSSNHAGIVSGRNNVRVSVFKPSTMVEGRALYSSMRFAEAREVFASILLFQPDEPEALYKRAVCDLYYYGARKWAPIRGVKYLKALKDLEQARLIFARYGKSRQVLTVSHWIDEVENVLAAAEKAAGKD